MANNAKIAKPKTNWRALTVCLTIVWIGATIYVLNSEFKSEAALVLPIVMVASGFLVFVIFAIIGSITQEKFEVQVLQQSDICAACGSSDNELKYIDYDGFAFVPGVPRLSHRVDRDCGLRCPNRVHRDAETCILDAPRAAFWPPRRRPAVEAYRVRLAAVYVCTSLQSETDVGHEALFAFRNGVPKVEKPARAERERPFYRENLPLLGGWGKTAPFHQEVSCRSGTDASRRRGGGSRGVR